MSFSQHIDRPARPGDVVLPFGKYRGKTLGEIAEDDAGLLYLDWLVGQDWFIAKRDLAEAVGQICQANSQRIEDAMENRRSGRDDDFD